MPLYFFHLRDREQVHKDSEGRDLPDLHAALSEVLQVNQELANDVSDVDGLEFEIADAQGRTLLRVPVHGLHGQILARPEWITGRRKPPSRKQVLH